jgi:hypothetical protein
MGGLLQLPSTPRRPSRPNTLRKTKTKNPDTDVKQQRQLHTQPIVSGGLVFKERYWPSFRRTLTVHLMTRPPTRSTIEHAPPTGCLNPMTTTPSTLKKPTRLSNKWGPLQITDQEKLRSQLVGIRTRGFASAIGECQAGTASIAAPIFDHVGNPSTAMSICGTAHQFRNEIGDCVPPCSQRRLVSQNVWVLTLGRISSSAPPGRR